MSRWLVTVGVVQTGYRHILAVTEGAKEADQIDGVTAQAQGAQSEGELFVSDKYP